MHVPSVCPLCPLCNSSNGSSGSSAVGIRHFRKFCLITDPRELDAPGVVDILSSNENKPFGLAQSRPQVHRRDSYPDFDRFDDEDDDNGDNAGWEPIVDIPRHFIVSPRLPQQA
ncbi:hypothetical protein EDD21DRAFT_358738 [Dissophora ornata]|nr:hypothetical protein EDD21DRAFT_358738 [Dissophora ornata]